MDLNLLPGVTFLFLLSFLDRNNGIPFLPFPSIAFFSLLFSLKCSYRETRRRHTHECAFSPMSMVMLARPLSLQCPHIYILRLTDLTSRKPFTYRKDFYVWNLQRGSSSPRKTPLSTAFILSSRSPRSLRLFSLFMTYHMVLTTTIFPTR